jgi:hypothetical protein
MHAPFRSNEFPSTVTLTHGKRQASKIVEGMASRKG